MKIFQKNHEPSGNNGFTMVELIIVLSVLTIIAAVAIPGFMAWLPDYRLKAATRDVFSDFQRAKILAVKHTDFVAVTFTADADGNPKGYMVYVDSDRDFTPTDADGNTEPRIIREVRWDREYKGSVDVNRLTFGDNANGNPAVAFMANGIPADEDGAGNGRIRLKNTNGKEREVVVSRVGNLRIEVL